MYDQWEANVLRTEATLFSFGTMYGTEIRT